MEGRFDVVINELKNVKTIGLACLTSNVLEKIFWATLGILGIAWGFYFIPSNFEIWVNNPSMITKSNLNLSQIRYPAITIKPTGITKYAFAERLMNYIKQDKLPNELREFRNILLKCATLKDKETQKKSDYHYYSDFKSKCLFSFSFTNDEKFICEVSLHKDTFS